MSNRIEKVNSLLEHEIAKILLHDFAFAPDILVTLTRVDSSANLIEAKVFISVWPAEKTGEIIKILNKKVFDVQQKINRTLKMRPVPKIKFVKDEDIAKAGRIEELLEKLKIDEK